MSIKALLFDMDDTLYDFSATWQTVTRRMLEELLAPYPIDPAEIWPRFVRCDTTLFDYVNSGSLPAMVARRLRWQFLEVVYDITIPNLSDLLERHTRSMRRECVPFPETKTVVSQLAGRFRLAVVTNGPADLLGGRLDSIELSAYFPPTLRIAADAVGAFKPDPKIFRVALEKLRVMAAECLFIGDSWSYDVVGASALGIPVVWYNPRRLPCPDPSLIVADIPSLTRLPALLR
ncbi:MAG: HAD family hydrolase [Thermaerobacter sp.]|nr:HAD family hydrolase [Thermaerobacter sp.]